MKLSSILISLGLALLLVLTSPTLPWGQTSVQWNNPAIASPTASPCANVATINNGALEIHYSPDCLEQKIHLSQLLHRLEPIVAEKTSNKITVSNLNYALIPEGINLQADVIVNVKPLPGNLPVSVSQDLSLSIQDGYLYIKAGETDLESSKLVIKSSKGMITKKLDQELARFNGKKLDEVLAINQLNTLAEPIGISSNAVDFVIQSIENKLNLSLDERGLTLAVRLR
ncbi:hypothetical protein J0895_22750 [Phormidium pseudopriestleyi FRX01]|uniref:DUF2993 domain-containing protein n=1 Tax=Phormidium pseudopriestleyi FRX01 TaxID=1759528 RepID=A0ABS3FXH2_9CYAN|nr:hypothetical protein [Phormidium pseudopriestleyi]MBO0351847.1 hypothetical protein [Phormidium pseudopriestleyi FRX01]